MPKVKPRPSPPAPPPRLANEALQALQRRCQRGLATPVCEPYGYGPRRAILTLARQFAAKGASQFGQAWATKAQAEIEKLEAACGYGTKSLPTTVGALRQLLAGLPDNTKLTDVLPGPSAEGHSEWLAQVAKVVGVLPPVSKFPERGGGVRRQFTPGLPHPPGWGSTSASHPKSLEEIGL